MIVILCDLCDLHDLYNLAHVAGCEPYNLRFQGHVSEVRSVLYTDPARHLIETV